MKDLCKKITAAIIAASVLFILLFSVFFIAKHVDHDCTGDDCPVCACLQQYETVLRGMETGMTVGTGICVPVLVLMIYILLFYGSVAGKTPVSIKVRLNN